MIINDHEVAIFIKLYTHKIFAIIECFLADSHHAVWKSDACKALAFFKRTLFDTHKLAVFCKIYTYKACATEERTAANIRQAAGDRDTCNAGAIFECIRNY